MIAVREVERGWGGIDLLDGHAGRRVLKKGELRKRSRKKDILYQFVLFSDALMYGSKEINGVVKLHRMIPLDNCDAQEPSSVASGDASMQFDIVSSAKSFRVLASTAADRNEWLVAIQDAVKAHRKANGMNTAANLAPVWAQDSDSSACPFCSTAFTVLRRRHHCRACGSVACDNCSTKRIPLPHVDEKKNSRVCDKCYDKLKGGLNEEDVETRSSRGSSAARFMSRAMNRMTLKRGMSPRGVASWRSSVSARPTSGRTGKSWRLSGRLNNANNERRSFAAEGDASMDQVWTANPMEKQNTDVGSMKEHNDAAGQQSWKKKPDRPSLAPRPRLAPRPSPGRPSPNHAGNAAPPAVPPRVNI